MARLPEGEIQNREERVLGIIREHPGIGFNKLHRECQKVCARQTLKKIIDKFVENKLIIKDQHGTQVLQYFIKSKVLEDAGEVVKNLQDKLKFEKYGFKVFTTSGTKLDDSKKVGFMGMLYYGVEQIIYEAELNDLWLKIQGKKYSIFKNVLSDAKDFRHMLLEKCLRFKNSNKKPPKFVVQFNDVSELNYERNMESFLNRIPKKYLGDIIANYFEDSEVKEELEQEEKRIDLEMKKLAKKSKFRGKN